jgi:hypothetical protein
MPDAPRTSAIHLLVARRKTPLTILLEIHAVPESQNGAQQATSRPLEERLAACGLRELERGSKNGKNIHL